MGPVEEDKDKDDEQKKKKKKKKKRRREKEVCVETEDQIHYWVPRVRLMFAAEDPTVFASRVANAHRTR